MPDWLVARFSLTGLVVVVLQQAPGIVRAIHPPKVDPFARNSGTLLVEILEKTFGIATVLLLVVVPVVAPVHPRMSPFAIGGSVIVLATYYLFYVLYSLGFTSLPILLG